MRTAAFLFCLCLVAFQAVAVPFSITNTFNTTNGVSLSWDNVTDIYIVAQSPSLTTGQFQYVGNVLATNATTVSNSSDTCFYRIREVQAVQFPDTNFESLIMQKIPLKHSPTNQIYDIDVKAITNLWIDTGGPLSWSITNVAGINALTGLQTFECGGIVGGPLRSLDFSGCTNLQNLYCWWNQLTNLNVSGCTNLRNLYCGRNQLANLDVSGCVNLQYLDCTENQLTNLDVSGCISLQTLYSGINQLTNLDVSGCVSLQNLICADNQLTNLNVSGCTNLQYLNCQWNQLANLDVSSCVSLQLLDCQTNQLSDISSFLINASKGGLGVGDSVYLYANPLSDFAITNQIPILTDINHVTVSTNQYPDSVGPVYPG
jgi:Leucine-rich repeat (LRR) protein